MGGYPNATISERDEGRGMRDVSGRVSTSMSEKNTKGYLRLDPRAAMHALIDVQEYGDLIVAKGDRS